MFSQLTTQAPSLAFSYEDLMRLRKCIDDALAYTGDPPTHTFMDVVAGIEAGRFYLWPGEKSAIVSEIMVYPRRRGMHIFLAGGKMAELIEMQKDLGEWAKEIGCDHMSGCGRVGWQRAMLHHGWGDARTILTRELKDE